MGNWYQQHLMQTGGLPIVPLDAEAQRRKQICLGCAKWDKAHAGCSLFKSCERHEITRAMWKREASRCRLGYWGGEPDQTCVVCNADLPLPDASNDLARPDTLTADSEAVRTHVESWRGLLERRFDPPKLYGQGIVTCGEGRYWPNLVVGVRLLRELGSTLPVQVWHRGVVGPELDADPHTRLIDVRLFEPDHPARINSGLACKSYAIVHSGFEQLLWLDADAYCVTDPARLFVQLDGRQPFQCWSTAAPYMETVNRELTGAGPAIDIEVQGGQLLIDCRRAWRELMLVRWIDDHSDYYWSPGVNRFHDESSWRMVLQSTLLPYLRRGYWWAGGSMVCDVGGEPAIVHRINSKLFGASPQGHRRCPREHRVFQLYRDLVPAPPPDVRRTALRRQRQEAVQ